MTCICEKCQNEMTEDVVRLCEIPSVRKKQTIIYVSCTIFAIVTVFGGLFILPVLAAVYFYGQQKVPVWRCGVCNNWLYNATESVPPSLPPKSY